MPRKTPFPKRQPEHDEREGLSLKRQNNPLGQHEVMAMIKIMPKECARESEVMASRRAYTRAIRRFRETPKMPSAVWYARGAQVLLAAAVKAGVHTEFIDNHLRVSAKQVEEMIKSGADISWIKGLEDGRVPKNLVAPTLVKRPRGLPSPRRRTAADDAVRWIRTMVSFLLRSEAATHPMIFLDGTPLFVAGDFECPPWTRRACQIGRDGTKTWGVIYDFPGWNEAEIKALRRKWVKNPDLQSRVPWVASAESTIESVLRKERADVEEDGEPDDANRNDDGPALDSLLDAIYDLAFSWPDRKAKPDG